MEEGGDERRDGWGEWNLNLEKKGVPLFCELVDTTLNGMNEDTRYRINIPYMQDGYWAMGMPGHLQYLWSSEPLSAPFSTSLISPYLPVVVVHNSCYTYDFISVLTLMCIVGPYLNM